MKYFLRTIVRVMVVPDAKRKIKSMCESSLSGAFETRNEGNRSPQQPTVHQSIFAFFSSAFFILGLIALCLEKFLFFGVRRRGVCLWKHRRRPKEFDRLQYCEIEK